MVIKMKKCAGWYCERPAKKGSKLCAECEKQAAKMRTILNMHPDVFESDDNPLTRKK